MTVLSADQDIARKEDVLTEFPVTASEIIYKGALVCVDTDGYLVAAADTAGYKFAGIAYEKKDNATGSDADKKCRVYTKGVFLLTCTSIAQTMVGQLMYVADDDVVDESATNYICVGRLVKYVSETQGWVDIGDRQAASGEADIHLSGTNRIYFRDTDMSIYSDVDGRLMVRSDTKVNLYGVANAYDSILMSSKVCIQETLRMSADNKIEFRDAGVFIHSSVDGRLMLTADTKINLYGVGNAYDSILMSSKVCIQEAVRITSTYRLEFCDANAYVYSAVSGRLNLTATVKVNLYGIANAYDSILMSSKVCIQEYVRITAAYRLEFRDATSYIYSPAAGKLTIVVPGAGNSALYIVGTCKIESYLTLAVVSAAGTVKGQIWLDTDDDKLHFYDGAAERVVTDDR